METNEGKTESIGLVNFCSLAVFELSVDEVCVCVCVCGGGGGGGVGWGVGGGVESLI